MISLTLVRRIKARPAVVFAALTTAEGITHWWGPDEGPVLFAESDAQVGGRFRVRFRKLDGSEHEASGEYLEVVDAKRLVMSWQWVYGGEPDERGEMSQVEVELRPIDIGTELTFTHARLQTEVSRLSHGEGWSYALDKLERYLSTGSPIAGDKLGTTLATSGGIRRAE
jgi:uncharacterized protein YndB with AHSA1/START domain